MRVPQGDTKSFARFPIDSFYGVFAHFLTDGRFFVRSEWALSLEARVVHTPFGGLPWHSVHPVFR